MFRSRKFIVDTISSFSTKVIIFVFSTYLRTGSYMYYYSLLYVEGGFIVFGGYHSSTKSVITRLDLSTTSWTKLGDLKVGRQSHKL